jgi:hypothetical protein
MGLSPCRTILLERQGGRLVEARVFNGEQFGQYVAVPDQVLARDQMKSIWHGTGESRAKEEHGADEHYLQVRVVSCKSGRLAEKGERFHVRVLLRGHLALAEAHGPRRDRRAA